MLYKSKTIEFLTDDMKISNLCFYNNNYYYESDTDLKQAESVCEEEFEKAVNSIVSIESISFTEPHQPTNAEVAQMISDLQADLIIAGVI